MLAIVAAVIMAAPSIHPTNLRCEALTNPSGIDEARPRLSWIVESPTAGARQVAYRIRVASTPEKLTQPDLWDSGHIQSAETLNREYRGKALREGERAWWTVEVVGADGVAVTSKPAFWEQGIRSWQAKWIGRANADKHRIDPAGAKWIWHEATDPKPGDRFFRLNLELDHRPRRAHLFVAADDSFVIRVNGEEVGTGRGWTAYTDLDATRALHAGKNEIVVIGHNDQGRAGVLVLAEIDGQVIRSGRDWQSSADGVSWRSATEIGDVDTPPFGPTRWTYGAEPAPILRRQITIAKEIARARLYASAKGLYVLTIDGQRVGHDIFSPGWTDYRKRIQYQTYDVTDQIGPGSHEVRMTLGDGWYCGHVGWSGREQYGPKPMGLCQIEIEYADGSHETLATDGSWQVGRGPILADDLLMGESVDARIAPGGWSPPDVQDIGDVPLVGVRSPTVQRLEELKAKKIREPRPGLFVFDLGQNMVGWARLNLRRTAGDRVTLRYAEMLNPDGTIYTANLRGAECTDTFILDGKATHYEPQFTFHGFRYVEVTGLKDKPGLDVLTGIVVGSAVPQTGTFECSSPLVNQLWHNIFWGQRGNYLEVPTDCPQRDERLGWMGDAQIFARTATYNNDIAGFMTKWLQDVRDAQSPEGGFSDVSPRIVDNADGAPAWGDAGVIVPWTMYLAYDDTRLLARSFDSMKAWVDYVDAANPDHIWVNRANNNFGDWLNVNDDTPRPVLATAYFAYSTDIVAKAARALGQEEEATKYSNLHERIRQAFNDRFVQKNGKIEGDTQTAYVLALHFDLLPEAMRASAEKRLADHILIDRKGHLSTGFVGVGYLGPTLTAMHRDDIAFRLLENDTYPSWGYSIRYGATTIWERWDGWTEDKGFQDPGMNSFNHYSLGSVGEWLYSTVAGIDLDPAQPGFKHILLHPTPGASLTWAKATYDSVRGRIESGWKIEGDQIRIDLVIPANTTATLHVPTSDPSSVRLDGKSAAPVIELESGHYTILARR